MSLCSLASCVTIKNLSTVVVIPVPAAGILMECLLSSHHEPHSVLVLGIKMSFKITFSLLIYLTFSFSVLMQTNSSWKAAKVGPRGLSTVTMFLAGRVRTWAMFAHLSCFIYFFFIATMCPSQTLSHLEGCMFVWEGLNKSLCFFKVLHFSCLITVTFWKENRPSYWALCPWKQLGEDRGRSCHGWVWWEPFAL